jgi:hypothetical protein
MPDKEVNTAPCNNHQARSAGLIGLIDSGLIDITISGRSTIICGVAVDNFLELGDLLGVRILRMLPDLLSLLTSLTAGRETPRAEMNLLFRHLNTFPCDCIKLYLMYYFSLHIFFLGTSLQCEKIRRFWSCR